jgi:hypothetical protein
MDVCIDVGGLGYTSHFEKKLLVHVNLVTYNRNCRAAVPMSCIHHILTLSSLETKVYTVDDGRFIAEMLFKPDLGKLERIRSNQ